ncbi:MAG: hypothetical protein IPL16_12870 [Ignavibacteria bacterium]|nr:hypothetical protein [Ignavibacteria bacterium]
MTKKKSLVLKYILKGRTISANEAKKCGIIDIVEEFAAKDWYRKNRNKYSKLSEQTVSQAANCKSGATCKQEQPVRQEQPIINHEKP